MDINQTGKADISDRKQSGRTFREAFRQKEMFAVYHSIISTLKLCGKSVWNFFGDYFWCEGQLTTWENN